MLILVLYPNLLNVSFIITYLQYSDIKYILRYLTPRGYIYFYLILRPFLFIVLDTGATLDIRRFLKNTSSDTANYVLDMDKIHEEEKYDGFYAVATNLDDSAKDILAVAQNRYKIEDCFRIMKTNFDARPVFLRKPERIRAHFLICYTALLIYRLMECKLDDNLTHVTTSNLIKTLRNMNVVNMDDMYYKSIYSGSQALDALERCFELQLNRKYYRPSDLNKIVKKFSK